MNAPDRITAEPLAVIRASSWPSLFDCAHRWYFQNIVGLRMPSSGNAALGTAIHAGTAAFDAARLSGEPVDVVTAVDTARAALQNPEQDVAWDDNLTPVEAEQRYDKSGVGNAIIAVNSGTLCEILGRRMQIICTE